MDDDRGESMEEASWFQSERLVRNYYYYYYAAFNAPCVDGKDDESQAQNVCVD